MAQVRCPRCSNLNPLEAEICSFCGARLKPVSPASENPEDAQFPGGENQPEDENDWLRALQGDRNDPVEEPSAGAESGEEMPDWLSRIRSRAQSELGGAEEPADWLQGLGEDDESAQPPAAPGWEAQLENFSAADQPEQPLSAEPASDLPNWLQDYSGEPAAADAASPAGQPLEEEDFSWLAPEAKDEQPSEPDPGFGLTGFLSSIQNVDQPADFSVPGQDDTTPLQDEVTASIPDWLNAESHPADAVHPADEAQPAAESSEAGLPDWLGGFAAQSEEESQQFAEPEQAAPGWLSGFEQPASQDAPIEQSSAPETEGLPSWLVDDQSAAGEPAPQAEAEPLEGLPDWMTAFESSASTQSETPEMQDSTPLFADELPGFGALPPAELEPSLDSEQDMPSASLMGETSPPEPEVPDWLKGFNQPDTSDAAVPPLFATEGELETTAHLDDDQPFAVDLPEWISEDARQAAGAGALLASEPAEEELAQAELPDWVKEMRPIESIIPGDAVMSEAEPREEKSGPLAGLAGILPAEEMASRYRRPPVYSAKLRVTEKQRGQAAQFENLIAQESQPLLVTPRSRGGQGGWLRLLVALLLILVLAVPPLIGLAPLAVPTLSPEETHRMYDHIESSQGADDAVLVAVEFDPALWGEMKLAAQPVIDHLMAKGARIVIVSTRPTGPALAEQLLTDTVPGHTAYILGEKTVNLGYLPGDTISLLEFAHQPAFAAPANLAGELAWEQVGLQGITSMRDFASVVVLTDTAETGRAWVEQVQPEMGEVPLLMVTSAQAAPLMAPFIESGQVDGMVSGLLGGVLYAQWTQTEGPGTAYLASYQVGVLLALALALGGGLISGAIAILNRGKDED